MALARRVGLRGKDVGFKRDRQRAFREFDFLDRKTVRVALVVSS
jgi:hypothetical protein